MVKALELISTFFFFKTTAFRCFYFIKKNTNKYNEKT